MREPEYPHTCILEKSLALRTSRHSAANVYGLHRTLGLYIGFPLLVLVVAGILRECMGRRPSSQYGRMMDA